MNRQTNICDCRVRQVIEVPFSNNAPLSHKSMFFKQNDEEILLNQEGPSINQKVDGGQSGI